MSRDPLAAAAAKVRRARRALRPYLRGADRVPQLGEQTAARMEAVAERFGAVAERWQASQVDRETAQDALATVRALRPATRRGVTRLVVRCPRDCPVVTVYAVSGRLLVELAGEVVAGGRTAVGDLPPVADPTELDGFIRHPGRWLGATAGKTWIVNCRHGPYPVSADRVAAEAPPSGARTVGVSHTAPPTVC